VPDSHIENITRSAFVSTSVNHTLRTGAQASTPASRCHSRISAASASRLRTHFPNTNIIILARFAQFIRST
jgi:hypothetical protein